VRLAWLLVLLTAYACVDSQGFAHPITTGIDQRPVAFASFDPGRLAAGANGKMVGFLSDGFIEPGPTNDISSSGFRFTYELEFRVVMVSGRGREFIGDGIRRIYFHPKGARASFNDPKTFARDQLIETDSVRVRAEYLADSVLVMKVTAVELTAQPFKLDGRSIELPPGRTHEMTLIGNFRLDHGGTFLASQG